MLRKRAYALSRFAPAHSASRTSPQLALLWEQPLASAALALITYVLLALLFGRPWSATPTAYYNYLADAFLHRQASLRLLPPSTHDLSFYQSSYYLYWPPMPAIMLMPFIALFGVEFSDTLFDIVVAALNVGLVALMLRLAVARGIVRVTKEQRGWLVLCFALGTVQLTLAPFGRVWNTGQITAFTWVAISYVAALWLRGTRAFLVAGLAMAATFLTRNHMLFAGVWPAVYLLHQHRSIGRARLAGNVLIGLLPVVAAIMLLGAYNWLRFGSALDNGLDYHRMAAIFVADYRRYGAFNLHYVPTNVFYQYIAYPFPERPATYFGGSLFLLTPLFFAVFAGVARMRPRWSMFALLGSIILVAIPISLLMGTGWVQFGPRYTLDFTVPLLLLTAAGIRRWPAKRIALLTFVSIVQYVAGTIYLSTII